MHYFDELLSKTPLADVLKYAAAHYVVDEIREEMQFEPSATADEDMPTTPPPSREK